MSKKTIAEQNEDIIPIEKETWWRLEENRKRLIEDLTDRGFSEHYFRGDVNMIEARVGAIVDELEYILTNAKIPTQNGPVADKKAIQKAFKIIFNY